MTPPTIAVIGSLNVDRSVVVPQFPQPGETVLGGDLTTDNGGKGANQAVAAARLGADVVMIGTVGDDRDGTGMVAALEAERVSVTGIATSERPTGAALITIDSDGENSIVVAPGANQGLTPEWVAGQRTLTEAAVVLAQLEVPTESVLAGLEAARGRFILNPAPAPASVEPWMASVDVLVPNRGELAVLSNAPVDSEEAVVQAARALDAPLVIVTLGASGALIVEGDHVERVAPYPAAAVDTTAAGDSFCGALAVALAGGAGAVEAATFAARCAAWTVGRRGAQSSLPFAEDVG